MNEFQEFFKNKFPKKEEVVDTNCYEDLASDFLTELSYDNIFVDIEAAKLVRVFGRWLDERK
jgi:hypothetical protein